MYIYICVYKPLPQNTCENTSNKGVVYFDQIRCLKYMIRVLATLIQYSHWMNVKRYLNG